MVFSLSESLRGLIHLQLKARRQIFNLPATAFLKRYEKNNIPTTPALDLNGLPAVCDVCGYSLVKITMENQWQLEMCSALPPINIAKTEFKNWSHKLVTTKLPKSPV